MNLDTRRNQHLVVELTLEEARQLRSELTNLIAHAEYRGSAWCSSNLEPKVNEIHPHRLVLRVEAS